MIKIMQLDSYSGFGGAERIMFEIVRTLRDEFEFVVMAPRGVFLDKLSQIGVETRILKNGNSVSAIKAVRAFIEDEKPDIIHSHGTRSASWARLALMGRKKDGRPRLVYTLHGFHIVRRRFFVRMFLMSIERFLNRWTDTLVCVSAADRNLVSKYGTAPPEKVQIVRNGIDIGSFRVSQAQIDGLRDSLGLAGCFVLCSVARLHTPKDFSVILRTLRILSSQQNIFRLLIVGDGPSRTPLEQEAKNLRVDEYTKFLGFRDDVPVLLNLSDIVILSTRWEGLPLVTLEAGACQKPVVASHVEGLAETVVDERTGYLFESGSEDDLAQKILKLFGSKDLREQMGRNALQFVSEQFSREKMTETYRSVYLSSV